MSREVAGIWVLMTKDEAEREAIRRWRKLPVMDRQEFEQAFGFAALVEKEIDFRTMGNKIKVIAAWLIRDIIKTREFAGEPMPAGDQKLAISSTMPKASTATAPSNSAHQTSVAVKGLSAPASARARPLAPTASAAKVPVVMAVPSPIRNTAAMPAASTP
jgi:hypothetical protein